MDTNVLKINHHIRLPFGRMSCRKLFLVYVAYETDMSHKQGVHKWISQLRRTIKINIYNCCISEIPNNNSKFATMARRAAVRLHAVSFRYVIYFLLRCLLRISSCSIRISLWVQNYCTRSMKYLTFVYEISHLQKKTFGWSTCKWTNSRRLFTQQTPVCSTATNQRWWN